MKIGFIGLGIMGSRMAANLQNSGHNLTVYNRTKNKALALINNGATWADSPKKLAESCDLIITMLSSPEVIKENCQGKNGFLNTLGENNLWVNCSTVNPSFSEEIAEIAGKHNVRYIDAPVAGTKGPAETGELLFLIGGKHEDIEEVQPLFDIMGKKTIYLGEIGKGSSMKMLINLMLAQSMLAFSEAMSLGESMGFEQNLLLDILTNSPVTAPVIAAIRPKLESGNYEANFPLKWIHKDLHLATITAFEKEVPMSSLNIAKEIYAQAKNNGHANNDFSAIYEYLKLK